MALTCAKADRRILAHRDGGPLLARSFVNTNLTNWAEAGLTRGTVYL